MGRAGWFDEVMRFFDRHVKGDAVADTDPPLAVESSDGTWRAESQWPPADSTAVTRTLNAGGYTDDGTNNGTAEGGSPNGEGVWTVSPPLGSAAHLAGVPHLSAEVSTVLPNANLVADVYDIDGSGHATLISRGTSLLKGSGPVGFDLYGDDWKLPAGHRVGVLLTGANAEWWLHVPTLQTVTVNRASIALPFLQCTRTATIQGGPSIKLDAYKADAAFTAPDTPQRSDFTIPTTQGC
jgi:uncharacterized protein